VSGFEHAAGGHVGGKNEGCTSATAPRGRDGRAQNENSQHRIANERQGRVETIPLEKTGGGRISETRLGRRPDDRSRPWLAVKGKGENMARGADLAAPTTGRGAGTRTHGGEIGR